MSHNAPISHNILVGNALGAGRPNRGFPSGTDYLSESGSDRRVRGPYGSELPITGNLLVKQPFRSGSLGEC